MTYNVSVCFSSETIHSCECSCQCGSQQDERILCVHILPVLFQISRLTFECFAEHILVELASFIGTIDERNINEQNRNDLHQIIKS
jgi:hypothetical protein